MAKPPQAARANTTATTAAPALSVEEAATRLGRAALAGDRATGLAFTMTYEQMLTLSRKAGEKDRAWWDEEIKDFFDQLAREGNDAAPTARVVGATIVKSGTLRKAEESKLLRDVEFALVQLVLEQDGRDAQPRGIPLLFFKTDAGWRFSPVK